MGFENQASWYENLILHQQVPKFNTETLGLSISSF